MKTLIRTLSAVAMGLTLTGSAAAAPAAASNWRNYLDPSGAYKISYPGHWQVLTKGNALVITSPGEPETRGVFGLTLRPGNSSIEDSVAKAFEDPDRSQDLRQAPARIANLPAIKVWGSKKGDPATRIVEYYIQKGDKQFYILFQAPHAETQRYSPVFNAMIGSLKFLN